MSKIKAYVIEPESTLMLLKEIDTDVESLQKIVGGYIEQVAIGMGLVVLCNEDGKRLSLPKSEILFGGMDPFRGTIIICGSKNGEYASLTTRQINALQEQLC